MERLTIHNGMYKRLDTEQVEAIYKKLRAYEDTGLEPEEFKESADFVLEMNKKLKLYLDAEQEGRLVVLPCKVLDTVWDTEGLTAEPSRHIVLGFDVLRSLNMAHLSGGQSLPVSEFGKTWFLTRSEAEAALKGVSEDANN